MTAGGLAVAICPLGLLGLLVRDLAVFVQLLAGLDRVQSLRNQRIPPLSQPALRA